MSLTIVTPSDFKLTKPVLICEVLQQVLRQLVSVVKAIGEVDLAEKFQEGADKIKRDIIFAASLYL